MDKELRRGQAWLIVLALFAISVLLRLPNLNRPLSKHHEFNTAVILANIDSWRQAGGGARFHYVPLLNYQNPGDRSTRHLANEDAQGNTLYLSFGPGWYVIPYFFYQLFGLPVQPVWLQIINLFFELAAVLLFFVLCGQLIADGRPGKYRTIVLASCLFMFSPGILWYLGNGYVNTGIMMPLVIGLIVLLIPMIQSPERIRLPRLLLLSLLIIVLVYIDWFVLFFSAVTGCWLLFRVRKEKKYWILFFTMALACLAGIAVIFFQFASYVGAENVGLSWQNRLAERSLTHRGESPSYMMLIILRHIVTCYFPAVALLGWSLVRLGSGIRGLAFSKLEQRILGAYAGAVVLYNLVLMDWSYEHEFALIPLSILLSILGARLAMAWVGRRSFYPVAGAFLLMAVLQYYLINRPGKVSRDGTPFDAYQRLGQGVRTIPNDYTLFMDDQWSAAVDFYAHRNIIMTKNIDSARAYVQRWGVPKAAWIQHDHYRFEKAVIIR